MKFCILTKNCTTNQILITLVLKSENSNWNAFVLLVTRAAREFLMTRSVGHCLQNIVKHY
jgi:hypothetical protein